MKSLYNSVISYMSSKIDKEISKINEQKQAAVKALEEQRDAEVKAVQDKIDALEDEKKAIQDANDERDRQLKLQEALYNLDKMQHDRSKMVYSEEQGMHYVTDMSGAREARTTVDDALDDIRIAELDKQIESLNDDLDKINERYDELIKQTEAYYDALIASLEKTKSFWEELADIEQEAKMTAMIEELGFSVDQLMHDGHKMEEFKQQYLALVSATNENIPFQKALSEVSGQDLFGDYISMTQNAADQITSTLDGINLSTIGSDVGIGFITGFQSAFANKPLLDGAAVSTDISNALKGVDITTATNSLGENIINGIALGAEQNALATMTPAMSAVAEASLEAARTAFEIHSPSQLFNQLVGVLLDEGIAEGIISPEGIAAITDAFSTLCTSLLSSESLTGEFAKLADELAQKFNEAFSLAMQGDGTEATSLMDSLFGDLLNPDNTALSTLSEAINSIKLALQEISTISIGGEEGGLVGQFNALADAITKVSSALGIGGDSAEQAGQSMAGGAAILTEGTQGTGTSVVSALKDLGETAQTSVGTDAVQAFQNLGDEVGNVLTSIGGGGGEENSNPTGASGGGQNAPSYARAATASGKNKGQNNKNGSNTGSSGADTLIGAIQEVGTMSEEEVAGKATPAMEAFRNTISEANEFSNSLHDSLQSLDDIDVEADVTVNVKVNVTMDGVSFSSTSASGSGDVNGTANVFGTVFRNTHTNGKYTSGPAHLRGLIAKRGPKVAHVSGLAHANGLSSTMHPIVAKMVPSLISGGYKYAGGNMFYDAHGNKTDMLANVIGGGGGGGLISKAFIAKTAVNRIFDELPISPTGQIEEYKALFQPGYALLSGTAFVRGGKWGAEHAHEALVGELGPEIRVNRTTGQWDLLGANGPEFAQIGKGDIIFNHLQTKDLLSKGNTIGRGKALADGNINTLPDGMSFLSGNNTLIQAMNKFNTSLDQLSPTIKSLQTNVASIDGKISSPNNYTNNSQGINLNIGDIVINEPVGDTSTLSQNIINKLPNAILQEIYKR